NVLLQPLAPPTPLSHSGERGEQTASPSPLSGRGGGGVRGEGTGVGGFSPKITDFGLAKHLEAGGLQTQSGAILGTPCYMAPEQTTAAGREVGPAIDVYALGAILYEMLAGRPVFQAATVLQTLEMVRSSEPVPPSRL